MRLESFGRRLDDLLVKAVEFFFLNDFDEFFGVGGAGGVSGRFQAARPGRIVAGI